MIRVKRLRPDARLPEYATAGAAGFDLAVIDEVRLWPGEPARLGTGLVVIPPPGHYLDLRERSSWFLQGLVVRGVIDEDYRGELHLLVTNVSGGPVRIPAGARIAQALVVPVVRPGLALVDVLDETERGTGGLGSTGA